MTLRYSPNTPVSNYQEQALLYYHWLTFCNLFTEVEANGVWTFESAGTDGIINNLQPSRFTTVSASFTAGDVGKYLAIRDDSNTGNTTIAQITSFISTTQVQLNSPVTNFQTSSTGVFYRKIDPTSLPGVGNYFVIQNPVTSGQPKWQARFIVRTAVPFTVGIEFGPIGGWDNTTALWTLPVCTEVLMEPTVAQSFMLADPDTGFVFLWTEDVGGIASDRKGCWLGSLSPFHAPNITGTPSDVTYGAIFGDTTGAVTDNFGRDTTVATNICVGQTMHSDNSIIPVYWAQKRLLGSGTDTQTITAANPNPRSSESDDYDMIAFQKSPVQAFRGRVRGIRLLSDSLTNRTLISGGNTYVISTGNGIGVSWDGRIPV